MSKIPLLLPVLLAASAAFAAEDDLVHASRLRDEAAALRAQAEERLRAAEPACYERFLVNRCLAEAKDARLDTIRKARAIEAEASRIELAHKRREAAERGAERERRPEASEAPAAPQGGPTDTPTATPLPMQPPETVPDAAAEETRRLREAEAARAAATARAKQQAEDAEKARARASAKEDAERRADEARRDRERYDERIRRREQEKSGGG